MTKEIKTQALAVPSAGPVVKMIRPEDRSAEPCVAEVSPGNVDAWLAEGWVAQE